MRIRPLQLHATLGNKQLCSENTNICSSDTPPERDLKIGKMNKMQKDIFPTPPPIREKCKYYHFTSNPSEAIFISGKIELGIQNIIPGVLPHQGEGIKSCKKENSF